MARQIDSKVAVELLAATFAAAEEDFNAKAVIGLPKKIVEVTERLFASETQAYREALIGCAVARILDPQIDIRLPATRHGDNSFSGRGLADRVISPFMRKRAVPISAGPYLSSLRGGARFMPGGEPRIQRDQGGFDALVSVIDFLRELDAGAANDYLRFLLRRFVQLRETGKIDLRKIAKPNFEQLGLLIDGLLKVKSGGRIAALLGTAMFITLSECHTLGWTVEFQGINVADKAAGAIGDITIKKGEKIVLGVEVTERPVEPSRVTLIFEQKVSPTGLEDYLFLTTAKPEDGALTAARGYTAVGHEMNFVSLREWLVHNLATIGPVCRVLFQAKMIELLSAPGSAADLKVAWNECMDAAIHAKGETAT